MAPGLSNRVSDFAANREHARGYSDNSAPPSRPRSSPSSHPTHQRLIYQQPQGPELPPNADLARRRQLKRQALGEELKFVPVGPPTIVNPEALPVKQRSSITLIEKAQNTLLGDPSEDIAALASQVASFQLSPFKRSPRGTFDDTDSMTTDTDYVGYPYATDYNKGNPASNPNLKHVASDHANQMRGQVVDEEDNEEDYDHDFGFGPDWKAQVVEEKAFRGVIPGKGPIQEHGYYAGPTQVETRGMYAESSINMSDGYDDDEQDYQQEEQVGYEIGDADGARTPTQAKNQVVQQDNFEEALVVTARDEGVDYIPTVPANTASTKPETARATVANTGSNALKKTVTKAMAPPPKPAEKKVDKGKQSFRNVEYTIPMRTTTPPTTFDEAKATSFGDSSPSQTSEDELTVPDPTAPKAYQHAFEDSLDYGRDELADKSYADLDHEPFLTDPNRPARTQPAVEQTLEQKLSAMTDMSEEQCKAMFEAMTDAENEGTGEWFMEEMKKKMTKLMRAKHNRRMIAAKYEHEVKKRNALVNAKTKDVADELESLKSGLGNLMPTQNTDDKKARREATKAAKKARKKGEAGT